MAYLGIDPKAAYSSYRNIDDISATFDGFITSFPLTVGGVAPPILPISEQQLLINVGGAPQQPDPSGAKGFRLSGGNIIFSSAPAAGETFWGVILASANYISANTKFTDGSASFPAIAFASDITTGTYSPGVGQLAFSTTGSEKLRINSAGAISLGATGTNTGTTGQALISQGSSAPPTWGSSLVSRTAVPASGTSIDFLDIPSWVKRITVVFDGLSMTPNNLVYPLFQLGDSGGIETTGYSAYSSVVGTDVATGVSSAVGSFVTNGFLLLWGTAASLRYGTYTFTNITGNQWTGTGLTGGVVPGAFVGTAQGGGTKTLSGTLDRIRITTDTGTDTFDAGSVNILYE